jgi:cation transport ATPase
MDPKDAAKLGKDIGEALTDGIFGIVDVVKNAPAQKAANNQRVINQNKITELNNQTIRNNNLLRQQAMKEIADEQQAMMMARMTPSQRKDFLAAKAQQEKAREKAKRETEKKAEETKELMLVFFLLFIVLPFMVWVGLLIWGLSDPMAYYSLKSWVPLLHTLVGR